MTTKPTLEEIEPIAFNFAKSLIVNNSVSDDELSNKAMELALKWYEEKQKRSLLIEQAYPNWIDLREPKTLDFFEGEDKFKIGSLYWIIGKGVDGRFNLLKGELLTAKIKENEDCKPVANFSFKTSIGNQQAIYILKSEDDYFNDDLYPNPPKDINHVAKQKTFIQTYSY